MEKSLKSMNKLVKRPLSTSPVLVRKNLVRNGEEFSNVNKVNCSINQETCASVMSNVEDC